MFTIRHARLFRSEARGEYRSVVHLLSFGNEPGSNFGRLGQSKKINNIGGEKKEKRDEPVGTYHLCIKHSKTDKSAGETDISSETLNVLCPKWRQSLSRISFSCLISGGGCVTPPRRLTQEALETLDVCFRSAA